jgi:hypothetical protein
MTRRRPADPNRRNNRIVQSRAAKAASARRGKQHRTPGPVGAPGSGAAP